MRGIAAHIIIVCFMSCTATAATRVAVLAPRGSTAERMAALLETTLSSNRNIQLVERQHLSAALQEQQLAACFGADNILARLKLGQLLKADTLVVLREQTIPSRHLEIVVFEARHGLRLLVEPAPLTNDIEADTHRIEQCIFRAITKMEEGITTVVAVPDFVCDDLTREFNEAGGAYARLVEQSLLKRSGVVVVEIAEAQAIARELAVAGEPSVDRPLPFLLLGTFHDNGLDHKRTITIALVLKKGEAQLDAISAANIASEKIAATVLDLTDRVIGTKLAKRSVELNPASDARQLYERATAFVETSDFRRGLSLCEACLLLQSIAEAHRDAAFAAMEICIEQREKAMAEAIANEQLKSLQFPTECQPLLNDGFAHAEAYMRATPLEYLAPANQMLRRYCLAIPAEQWAEMVVRVARAKADARVCDDTLRYASEINWRAIEPAANRYALATRLALLARQQSDVRCIVRMFQGDGNQDDASSERDASLRELATSENAFARSAVAEIKQIAVDLDRSLPSGKDSPASTQNVAGRDGEVSLVPLDIGLASVYGCFPAGNDLDIFWGANNDQTPAMVCVLPKHGMLKPLCRTLRKSRPAFDGRYIWTAGEDSARPQIVIVDPITMECWAIEPKDGLPNEAICAFAAAPLAPGRICAAIAIGSAREMRSYIAILSLDRADRKTFTLIDEQKLSALAPGVDRFDPHVAFAPRTAERLLSISTPKVAAIVGFTGGFGWRLVTFPDFESTVTGRGAIVNTDKSLLGHYVHEGRVYETRVRRSVNDITANLLCSTVGGANPRIITTTAINGPLQMTERETYIFCPGDLSLYVEEMPSTTFRRLKTTATDTYIESADNTMCRSNRFGLLLLSGLSLHQFQDAAGKPLLNGQN